MFGGSRMNARYAVILAACGYAEGHNLQRANVAKAIAKRSGFPVAPRMTTGCDDNDDRKPNVGNQHSL